MVNTLAEEDMVTITSAQLELQVINIILSIQNINLLIKAINVHRVVIVPDLYWQWNANINIIISVYQYHNLQVAPCHYKQFNMFNYDHSWP